MLFARLCCRCRAVPVARQPLCPACQADLEATQLHRSPAPPPGLDWVVALHPYRAEIRSLVLAAKNGGQRGLLRFWGRWLGERAPAGFDVVTWVPASRSGARRRGGDQGRALARSVATANGLAARRLLVRRPGQAQAGSGRSQRLIGPTVRAPLPSPNGVLLVDDVMATGASLAAAAEALRLAGADRVGGLVIAAATGPGPGSTG